MLGDWLPQKDFVCYKKPRASFMSEFDTNIPTAFGWCWISQFICFVLWPKEIQLVWNQKCNNLSLLWFLMWFDNWIDPFAEANAEDSGAGTKEYVHVRVQQRNGRKSLTTVQGLKKEYSYSKILKDLKKEFCCNGTVVQDPELGQVCLFSSSQIMHNVIILFCNCRSLK